jgi:cobalt-zinc-cadmium efflux system protein
VNHNHDVRAATDRRALAAALALISVFLVAEVVAAVISGSLALFADAGHMLADVVALALALGAAAMAPRPAEGRWTFGFRRLEIVAAQVNGIVLAAIGLVIVYSSARRLADPSEVRGGIVLVVALAGVAVSLAATALLARAGRESLNVRGAFLHVATDLAAFAGTAVAGGLILATGWDRFDPLAGLAVAALVLWSAYGLLREATGILLEMSPAGIDPVEVGLALAAEPQVVEVHDLHLWTVTSGFPAFSAHVLVEGGSDCHAIRRDLETLLAERFGLDHTTLQVEHAGSRQGLVKLRAWRH